MKPKTFDPEKLIHLTALDIMSSPVVTVSPWDSIHDVAKVFIDNNISAAPVVDLNNKPLGVITKTDLARYDQERANLLTMEKDTKSKTLMTHETIQNKGFHVEPEEATIESWMTPALYDVHTKDSMPEIAKKMVKNGLHHIFVTEKETGRVQGIITSFDILTRLNHWLNYSD